MSNREKLFKLLEGKDNKCLAEMIDFICDECPANSFCSSTSAGVLTCQETLCAWLELKEEK